MNNKQLSIINEKPKIHIYLAKAQAYINYCSLFIELMANIHTRKLVEQLMREVAVGAKSDGRIIEDSFIQMMLDYTVKMKPYRTSMKIDYDENRPLEVEAIFGNPLRKAQEKGANLPQIECLYQQLKFLDVKNHK